MLCKEVTVMKKIFLVCLLVFIAALGFANSDDLGLYSFLYNNSTTQLEQLSLLNVISRMELNGAGEFYATALSRLISANQNIRGATDRNFADEQAILLANLLGQEKHTSAAADLWRMYDAFTNPLVRAEVLMALGKMQAADLLPQVISELNRLNTNAPAGDRLNSERIAFGAIIALEKYQDISGYLPVYFASVGWYSDRITDQARRSLEIISSDPTEPMLEVIRSSGSNYETKLTALRTIESSSVPAASKSQVAVAALSEGWRATTTDVRLRGQLVTIRRTAMGMIRANGASDDEVYPLLERSYRQFADRTDGDRDEAIETIVTLRTLATEEAARRLSSFLMTLNSKLQSGTLTNNDQSLVREIIPALGATRQAVARQALSVVIALDWPPAVKTLAEDALKQIP